MIFGIHFHKLGIPFKRLCVFINNNSLEKEVGMTATKRMTVLFIVVVMVMMFSGPSWAGDAGKINLNKATAVELSQLKGIGMKYAERIVEYREKNGPFKNVEDLLNVQGIGPKTLEKNKDLIMVK
jgi:competence protein ComEA